MYLPKLFPEKNMRNFRKEWECVSRSVSGSSLCRRRFTPNCRSGSVKSYRAVGVNRHSPTSHIVDVISWMLYRGCHNADVMNMTHVSTRYIRAFMFLPLSPF